MLSNEMVTAISILLRDAGCTESYLFGSHVTGGADERADVDIGIKGLAPHKFFAVHSLLEDTTRKNVDLVDFDEKPQFFAILRDLGELRKIG